jgi:molecular chaperone GrpE
MEDKEPEKTKKKKNKVHHSGQEGGETKAIDDMEVNEYALPEVTQEDLKADLEAELAELTDKYMRLAAEFDNYKKRQVRETSRAIQCGAADLIRELLPVLDNLERASSYGEQEEVTREQICAGLCLTAQDMLSILNKQGVNKVEVKPGDAFDPHFMEAVSAVPTSEHPDHSVMEVTQEGYTYGDILLRPAKVVVAVAPKE